MNSMHDQVTDFVNQSEGWTSLDRCLELFDLIIEHKPKVVVEIGVYGGRTLIPQALALREVGQGGHIYGIDPWRTESALEGENEANREWWRRLDIEEFHRKTMGHIWRLELDPWCSIIRAPSQYVADLFDRIDFWNLDGNHSTIASCRDVELYLPRVSVGGIVTMDDCDWPSTQQARKLIEEHCETIRDAGHYKVYRKTKVQPEPEKQV